MCGCTSINHNVGGLDFWSRGCNGLLLACVNRVGIVHADRCHDVDRWCLLLCSCWHWWQSHLMLLLNLWLLIICQILVVPIGIIVVVLSIPLCRCIIVALLLVAWSLIVGFTDVVDCHSAVSGIATGLSTSAACAGNLFAFYLSFAFSFVVVVASFFL